jgi:hypothetical protein
MATSRPQSQTGRRSSRWRHPQSFRRWNGRTREELLVKEKELTRARDALAATLKRLTEAGLEPEPVRYPGGSEGPKTSWLTDPDGYRIELVEWPPGHPDGITEVDFS